MMFLEDVDFCSQNYGDLRITSIDSLVSRNEDLNTNQDHSV